MPQLRFISGASEGATIVLDGRKLVIGRDPNCDVPLDPASPASRHHASVYATDGAWHIQDMGSLNGTMVNGVRVEDSALQPGDQIGIGSQVLIFESSRNSLSKETAFATPAAPRAAPAAVSAPVAKAPASREVGLSTSEEAHIQQIVREMSAKTQMISNEIGKAIIGQKEIVLELLTAIISGGHVLMIGLPGLAKTTLISTLSEVLDLKFRRIQFTPDLMPSDITGTDILEVDDATGKKDYRFIKGPIFSNILLADEINRTPPKTQAALLEAMQEHRVTAAGTTYKLDPPFFVLATQNPLEQEGTYPLPEAQLDRFMFSVYVDYPDEESEELIAKVTTRMSKPQLNKVLNGAQIIELQKVVRELPISDHVVKYSTRLVRSTRPGDKRAPDFIKKWVHCGAGPRASQYLVVAAKARAIIEGRLLVTTDDVRSAARPILRHRMFTNFTADSEGVDTDKIVQKLIEAVPEPGEKDY